MSMPALEQKKAYFDRYWADQPGAVVDRRSEQRAGIIFRLLHHKSGSLLDAGCGRGVILDFFSRKGFGTVGLDLSPDMIQILRGQGHEAYVADLDQDTIPGQYDIILCLEVLQQVLDPVAILEKLVGALTEGGELVVSLPNEFHIISRLKILLGCSHLGHFEHSHIRFFSPRRDRELFQKLRFVIRKRAFIPIVPPKYRFLSALVFPLAQLFPSLLALSSIYILERQ